MKSAFLNMPLQQRAKHFGVEQHIQFRDMNTQRRSHAVLSMLSAALGLGFTSAGASAQGTELEMQFPTAGYASLQRLELGDSDSRQFAPSFSGGRLSDGSLWPDVPRSVGASAGFSVGLPRVCREDDAGYTNCWPALSIQGTGQWQASARAGFGSLGVAAAASVGGSSTGIDPFSGWPATLGVGATAVASYTESLRFDSTVLPLGSVVSFSVYSLVHAVLVKPATTVLQMGMLSSLSVTYAPTVLRPATGQTFDLAPHVWFSTGGGEQWHGVLASYEVQTGDIVSLKVTMDGRAGGSLVEPGPVWPDTSPVAFSDGASVSAMYSLATGITVTTPGVSLVTASGHDYTLTPVPEPGTWALTLAGVAGLLARRRRVADAFTTRSST